MSSLKIKIPYGKEEVEFAVPQRNLLLYGSYKKRAGIEDVGAQATQRLTKPIGCKMLSKLVRPGQKIAILVDDWTRPTPTKEILPAVLEELRKGGVSEKDTTIVVAKGSHRACTDKELEKKLGEEALNKFKVIQHDCDDKEQLTFLGWTALGTPVWVNRFVVESDFKIAIGNLGPTRTSGFSGGGKIVLPGISARDTIEQNHAMRASYKTGAGKVKDNPIRQDVYEAARMVGINFIVNTIMNAEGKVVELVAGDLVKAHERGANIVRRLYGVKIEKMADVAVVSTYPSDKSLFSAEKAAEIGVRTTKSGGTIVLVSPFYDGMGGYPVSPPYITPEQFYDFMVKKPKVEDVSRMIIRRELAASGGGFLLGWSLHLRDREILVVTKGVGKDQLEKMGFRYADSVESALEYSMRKHGLGAKVAVFDSSILLPLAVAK